MSFRITRFVCLAALCGLLALAGCDDDPPTAPKPDEPIADFHLYDVNLNSDRYGREVSPRDYLGKTTAWYFSRAT
jgi:hypothetical protein